MSSFGSSVNTIARDAWNEVETDGIALSLRADGRIDPDADGIQDFFESAFAFSRHNADSVVSVTLREDGFTITDDGDLVGDARREDRFDAVSVPDATVGMMLSNVRTLKRTHGWDVTVDTAYTQGARLVVSGVDVRLDSDERGTDGQPA